MFDDTGTREVLAGAARTGRDPRRRLLEAMVDTVALRGYDRTTISRVVASARLEEALFGEHFHDKRDCFWQAVDELIGRAEDAAIELFALPLPWAAQVRIGLERLLQALADDPAAARVLLVEMLAAGPEAWERRRAALSLFAALMERGRRGPKVAELAPQTSEAIVGGIASILHRRALQGETAELPALHADLTYFALLPYLDHERAQEAAMRADVDPR